MFEAFVLGQASSRGRTVDEVTEYAGIRDIRASASDLLSSWRGLCGDIFGGDDTWIIRTGKHRYMVISTKKPVKLAFTT